MGKFKQIRNLAKNLFENVEKCSQQCKRARLSLLVEMLYCYAKYSASPSNYENFQFYRLNKSQRSTYVTHGISQQIIRKYNDPLDIHYFEDKFHFADTFSEFYKRAYLDACSMTFSEFAQFCQGKKKVICKPSKGSQGAGIQVYHVESSEQELHDIYDQIQATYQKNCILEEWIEQHPVLSAIYPDAVNCLRVITVYDGKSVNILTGGVTFGISTEIANGSQPSIVAPVAFSTGIIHKPASTFHSDLYETHPTTNAPILGVQLPYWPEIKDMLEKACQEVPSVGYVGWDIAITPDGPVLIEGNTTPGYKYYQIPQHLSGGIGNLPIYARFL